MDNQSLSHTKWKCQYHIVWIPKYRQKKLYGALKEDIRDIIKTLCQYKQVELIEGAVCGYHIHIWSKAFWAREYYVTTIGNITEEAIKKYIEEQAEEDRKEDRNGAAF